jgi:hypothetical protein
MKVLFVILGLVGLALLWLVIRRVLFYRALFSDRHLHEVAAALPKLRRAALDGAANTEPQLDDPRAVLTSAGLVVLYTITRQPDKRSLHHLSVSLGGGFTPHGVGSYFQIFVLRGLGVDPHKVGFLISGTQSFHSEWSYSSSEQAAFAKKDVPPIAAPRELWQECIALRPELDFKRNRPTPA